MLIICTKENILCSAEGIFVIPEEGNKYSCPKKSSRHQTNTNQNMQLRSGTTTNEPTANEEAKCWYDLVDIYPSQADEAQFLGPGYSDALASMLGASKVEVLGFVPARGGKKGLHLRALASSDIVMKRLGVRMQGWPLLWKEDFEDQWNI